MRFLASTLQGSDARNTAKLTHTFGFSNFKLRKCKKNNLQQAYSYFS